MHDDEPEFYREPSQNTGAPAMHANEILDLIARNYRGCNNIHPIWMRVPNEPHVHDFAIVRGSIMNGDAFKIPFGWLTESTLLRSDGMGVYRRGWRPLLQNMFTSRWLNPSDEIEDILGRDVVYALRAGLDIGVCY